MNIILNEQVQPETIDLTDFSVQIQQYGGFTHPVYRKGQGPAVIIIHELPTITPEVVRFANKLVDAGFTVFLPHLMGVAGAPFSMSSAVKQLALTCIRREFAIFARHKTSPVVDFLRGLSYDIHQETGNNVGVVGMCLTGNFALALAVDSWVSASVPSQPSLPLGLSRDSRKALHISPEDIALIKKRVLAEQLKIQGLRFSHDLACPAEKFDTLKAEFGQGFIPIVINSGPNNPHGIAKSAHSVLTNDLVDKAGHPTRQALDSVIAFLTNRLIMPNS